MLPITENEPWVEVLEAVLEMLKATGIDDGAVGSLGGLVQHALVIHHLVNVHL